MDEIKDLINKYELDKKDAGCLHNSDELKQNLINELNTLFSLYGVSCSTYKIAISDRSCTYDYEIELPNTTCIRDIAKRLYSSFGLKEEKGILRK